jgi:hypothetical protein
MAVESASRSIDGYAGRYFYSAGTATRYYAADDDYVVQVDDLSSATITLTTANNSDGSYVYTWGTSDYQLEPLNGNADGIAIPYTRIRAVGRYIFPIDGGEALVKVVGTYGWASVPIAVTQACVVQASRLFKRLDSPLGVAGFGDLGVIRVGRALDPDVEQLVSPYRRMRGFA